MKFKTVFFIMMLILISCASVHNKSVAIEQEKYVFITGIILDNNGPIPGANIVQEGTMNGTSTDFDGKFKLKVLLGSKINIMFSGMKGLEYKVTEAANIKISLDENVIFFCCTNHSPSHCCSKNREMVVLASEFRCIFK